MQMFSGKSGMRGAMSALLLAVSAGVTTAGAAPAVALTPVPAGSVTAGAEPYSVTTDVTGNYVFVANHEDGNVSSYSADYNTGALSKRPSFEAYISPATLTAAPNGKFLYATNNIGIISAYALNGGATPSLIPGNSAGGKGFYVGSYASSGTIDAASRFLYVADYADGIVNGYAIDQNSGALNTLGGLPVSTPPQPGAVAITPSGQYLYVTSIARNAVTAYRIDSKGGLQAAGSPVGTGKQPQDAVVDPSGRFLYVANWVDGNVSGFRIDPASGALTPLSGSPYPAGSNPVVVTTDPYGKYVYVANAGMQRYTAGSLSAYRIDAASGVLKPLPGSPYATADKAMSVAASANGKFVYVANRNGQVSTYATNTVALSMYSIKIGISTSNFMAAVTLPAGIKTTASGFYYGPNPLPTAADNTLNAPVLMGGFSVVLPSTMLPLDTPYYVRPWLVTEDGETWLGKPMTFVNERILNPVSAPTVSGTTLRLLDTINQLKGETVQNAGFAFVTSPDSQSPVVQVAGTVSNNSFSASVTPPLANLGADIYVRPYIKTGTGVIYYGPAMAFSNRALMQTNAINAGFSNVTFSGALNAMLAAKSTGFVYGSASDPQVGKQAVVSGSGGNDFSASLPLSALNKGQTYYVRAYAVMPDGSILYGNNSSFLNGPAVTNSSTMGQKNMNFAGSLRAGLTASRTGFLYSLQPNPTLASTAGNVAGSSLIGNFSATLPLSAVESGKTFYVVAYATDNSGNTVYSAQTMFTNTPLLQLQVSNITSINGDYRVTVDPRLNNIVNSSIWYVEKGVRMSIKLQPNGIGNFGSLLLPKTAYTVTVTVKLSDGTNVDSNSVTFTTSAATLGQRMRFGVLVQLDSSGAHGLIANTINTRTSTKILSEAEAGLVAPWRTPSLAEMKTLLAASKNNWIELPGSGYWSNDNCMMVAGCPDWAEPDFEWVLMTASGNTVPQNPQKMKYFIRGVQSF